jgi:hypothetical protein
MGRSKRCQPTDIHKGFEERPATSQRSYHEPLCLAADISFPGVDTECDRLDRACARATTALLRIRDEPPPSSLHQPRRDSPPPTLAPKWAHWAPVLRIKRTLCKDGKDICDYVEAPQIDELYHRDVEERGRMAGKSSDATLSPPSPPRLPLLHCALPRCLPHPVSCHVPAPTLPRPPCSPRRLVAGTTVAPRPVAIPLCHVYMLAWPGLGPWTV